MTGTDAQGIADQAEVQAQIFAFLADPSTYRGSAHAAGPIARVDTHGAVVFLTAWDAYKIKRAVRFPFMDFSTLEKRRVACEHEIAVNRRNAPEIYLGTLPIRKDAQGFHLGGEEGDIVEWAVHLARFDETQTFDRLADAGVLDPVLMAPLAETIVAAHEQAPMCDGAATRMLRRRLDDTLDGLAVAKDIFPCESVAALKINFDAQFEAVEALLERREKSGQVRLCHGDLHLRNIVLHKSRPLLFDAIEFDDSIATCDVLYDFAFVLMDLWQRGLKGHANRLFNFYLWRTREPEAFLEGLAALPLFLALRAAIRARVTAALCRIEPEGRDARIAEARRFFAAAREFLESVPARLIGVGGLSGSGKSMFARELAPSVGRPPGAVHLRSDVERKRFFRAGPHDALPKDAYRLEVTARVYEHLRQLAAIVLKAGHSIVVDAVHAQPEEREALAKVAEEARAPFAGFWLAAPAETLIARVDSRENDASDAKADVVREQLSWDLGRIDWQMLDGCRAMEELRELALSKLTPVAE